MSAPFPVSILLLTVGREKFLTECLESIQKQTKAPSQLVVVNDGPALSPAMTQKIKGVCSGTEVVQTPQPRSGQWKAFRAGLEKLQGTRPFGIVHDDDRLKANYVETLGQFASRRNGKWICSHNLEVFPRQNGAPALILPKETGPLILEGRAKLCLRYSHSFLPFPGTCFGVPPEEVWRHVHEEYQEMADVVLLCECASDAKVFFEPDPIYEYRRHAGQVSENMGHAMEDRLQDYLLGAARGTPVENRVKRNLEKRRAERFFSWAWEAGTFRGYPYRKQFHWSRLFRCARNRKLLLAKIYFRDLLEKICVYPPMS